MCLHVPYLEANKCVFFVVKGHIHIRIREGAGKVVDIRALNKCAGMDRKAHRDNLFSYIYI